MSHAAHTPVPLRHTPGEFSCDNTPDRSYGPTRGPADRPLPHHAERRAMEGRGRGPAGTPQRLSAIHAHLIQLEKLVDRFRIASAGGIQQPPPLIQFFFFRMRCRTSFHRSKPFFRCLCYIENTLNGLVIIYCGCCFTKDFALWRADFCEFLSPFSK